MNYTVRQGDSPASIARKFNVPFVELIAQNPQKATTIVAGIRTWREIKPGEQVRIPVGQDAIGIGDAASDAVNALMAAGSPCDQANVALVFAAQHALGQAADGKWGADTARAAQARVPGAPGGCSPRPAWWAPAGQSNALPSAAPSAAPAAAPGGVTTLSTITVTGSPAIGALVGINPCDQANVNIVGAAQHALGVTADGKYGTDTAIAARQALGASAPAACSPRPAWWAPAGQSNYGPGAVHPSVAPAVAQQAATTAQQAAAQAAAATSAPAAQQAAVTAAQAASQAAVAAQQNPTPQAQAAAATAQQAAAQAATSAQQAGLVAPKEGGISTGAIVAGAVGVVALVGIIAAASMSGKGEASHPGHAPARRAAHRAPAHHRKTTHKRKPARRRR